MSGVSEFLAMSGDGVFVWPCYLMTAIVLIANVVMSRAKFIRLKRQARVRSGGVS